MINLESFHVFNWKKKPEKLKYFALFFRGLQHCKNLTELNLPTHFGDYANYTPNIKKLKVKGSLDFNLEDLNWIAKFKTLEILKLEVLRWENKEIDIEDYTGEMFNKLTHLKSLEMDDCSLMFEPDFLINIHEIIPSLETLVMEQGSDLCFPMDIDYLVEVLDSIGDVKNLCIKDYVNPFYLLNNTDFNRTEPTNLNEDQIKSIFETAMDIINKKFSIDSTSLKIVDNKYGWSIAKEKEKAPTMTQLHFKCTAKDEQGKTCTEFFLEKAEWEKHEKDGLKWIKNIVDELYSMDNVRILKRTTAMGYYDYNYLTALEKVTNHCDQLSKTTPRERYWRVRSKKIVLAQGAFERPLVFADNDRPGIMMASAGKKYLSRYGVLPGKSVVLFTFFYLNLEPYFPHH